MFGVRPRVCEWPRVCEVSCLRPDPGGLKMNTLTRYARQESPAFPFRLIAGFLAMGALVVAVLARI